MSAQTGTQMATQGYVKAIDGMRALAVLSVMLFHLDEAWLPGGFTGVDIFFVISGYVVSKSLYAYRGDTLGQFVSGFYARRMVRIFPALVLCLLLVALLSTLFVPSAWLSQTNEKTGLFAFFGASNFALVWFADGYFSPRGDYNPFLHTWSLGVEEQFYLLFPLLFFPLIKYRFDNVHKLLLWAIPALAMLSFAFSAHETFDSGNKAFFLLPSRFWELAVGAYLFQLQVQYAERDAWSEQRIVMLQYAGVVLLLFGFLLADRAAFPFPWAILPVLGSVLLIAGFVLGNTQKCRVASLFELPLMVYIGKLSYSLYLWHWPVFVLLKWTAGLSGILWVSTGVLLSFVLAALSYHFVEVPIRQRFKQGARTRSGSVVVLGAVLIAASTYASATVFEHQEKLSLSVTADKALWYPDTWSYRRAEQIPAHLQNRKLFAIGDSHTGAYGTMLQMLADEYGVEVVRIFAGGCGFVKLLNAGGYESGPCKDTIHAAIQRVKNEARPGDIVFLASMRLHRLSDQWTVFSESKIQRDNFSEKAMKQRDKGLAEAYKVIAELQALPVHLLIDAPKPVFRAPPFRCADWFNAANPVCERGLTITREELQPFLDPVKKGMDKLASAFPQMVVWDPFPVLCPDEVCHAFDGDKPMFFDADHLSAHGNRVLYPDFAALVSDIWKESIHVR